MIPFRERNTAVIGVIGLSVIGALMLASFRADRLPIIGSGDVYQAEFGEIGGLKDGNEVRVAGVSIGNVNGIELKGDKVLVSFKLDKGSELGDQTTADIRVRTLLGAEFLALQPAGPNTLKKGSTIPLSRTDAPYNVVEAFEQLSEVAGAIDTDQLASALETLADIAAATPEEFQGAIKGVSNLSSNLAARDEQINTLLKSLQKVSAAINSKDSELVTLFRDSDVLFRALADRRESIHQLLVSTQNISRELRALVKDTKADLNPALTRLAKVTDVLVRNKESLDEALRQFGDFTTVFSNALGTGPWFDTYLGGVPELLSPTDLAGTPGGG
ncbi:MAG: MCE family protein [Aeromicrobium sp.]|uniref:MCE family protein n=1 Tax=Aeromicrobium sp. TaxID=1871063 RepID=UPI003C5E213F